MKLRIMQTFLRWVKMNRFSCRHWLRLLSMELAARIEYDVKLNKRRPKTFHLYYRWVLVILLQILD